MAMGHAIGLNGRAFNDLRPGWGRAGKVAFFAGLVLFAAGYALAFTVPGAILWFAGAYVGVTGLVIWLSAYRAAWIPLGSLVLVLLLLSVSGLVQLAD